MSSDATRIGVLGGGQLGQMLGLAAIPLGLECVFYDPAPASPARMVGRHVCAAWDDHDALARFADAVDVVTFEFENVPAASLAFLAARKPVRPGVRSLELTCDRVREKEFLRSVGVPVESKTLKGIDSLLSIVQMPAGVPVGTLAIGRAGAVNAALLAASVLSHLDAGVAERLAAFRAKQTADVLARPIPGSTPSGADAP